MTREDLLKLKQKISELNYEQLKLRDLYLRLLAIGKIQGPLTGYASIDKPWLKNYAEEDLTTIYPKETLYEHIYKRNKNNLNSYALNYFGKRITYKELFNKIDEVASSFYALGIRKNDIVSFCVPTTPETIYSIYALNKIGAVANMIDLSTNNENILTRINSTNSKCLIMMDSLDEKLNDIYNKLNVQKIIKVSPTNSIPAIDFMLKLKNKTLFSKKNNSDLIINWKQFTKLKTNDKFKTVSYEDKSRALIVYTGGTTGTPKGAILGNYGINSTIYQLKATGIHSDLGDRYLDIMPPFIAYGVVCGIHNPLSERQEIVIIPKLEPQKFAGYIKKYKPNHVIGVPALFETMTKSEELKDTDLSFLKNMICGGDRLTIVSEGTINNFLESHHSPAKVSQGFGMTEVGTSVTYTINNNNNSSDNHIGSPLPLTSIKICEPGTEHELLYGEQGEICILTPSLMLGYYNNEEESKRVLKEHSDGQTWIHSQDLGYMDENGELYFLDRFKRMIIRRDGHNVWPGKIEEIISTHYAVNKCVVIGIPSEENTNGVIPTAVIVLKDEYKNIQDKIIIEIDELLKLKLPGRDGVQDYIIRDSLPKTSVGKIDFRKVELEEINIRKLKKSK